MNNYESHSLLKIQKAYDFVAKNPGCTLEQIAAHFMQPPESVRAYVRQLRDGLYLVSTPGAHVQRGQKPTTYKVNAECGRPVDPPTSRRKSKRAIEVADKVDLPCLRPRCSAVQLGMRRDPLVAALFGQVGA